MVRVDYSKQSYCDRCGENKEKGPNRCPDCNTTLRKKTRHPRHRYKEEHKTQE